MRTTLVDGNRSAVNPQDSRRGLAFFVVGLFPVAHLISSTLNGEPTVSAVGWKRDEMIFQMRSALVDGNRSAVNPQDSRPGLAFLLSVYSPSLISLVPHSMASPRCQPWGRSGMR